MRKIAQVCKYYVIYDHQMNSKYISRNFYYKLDDLMGKLGAKKIQYSVIVCSKKKAANKIAILCKKYGAKVKIINGKEINRIN